MGVPLVLLTACTDPAALAFVGGWEVQDWEVSGADCGLDVQPWGRVSIANTVGGERVFAGFAREGGVTALGVAPPGDDPLSWSVVLSEKHTSNPAQFMGVDLRLTVDSVGLSAGLTPPGAAESCQDAVTFDSSPSGQLPVQDDLEVLGLWLVRGWVRGDEEGAEVRRELSALEELESNRAYLTFPGEYGLAAGPWGARGTKASPERQPRGMATPNTSVWTLTLSRPAGSGVTRSPVATATASRMRRRLGGLTACVAI